MLLPYYLIAAAAIATASPTVYLIRHGEKPDDGGTGLSAEGVQRSQCLRSVFGKDSGYNIDGKRVRPYETVLPLAADLGLTVDTSCDRDDPKCVKKAVNNYSGEGNILICWQHSAMTDIVKKLGDDDAPTYPDDRYDLIWTDPSPYTKVTEITSEQCQGLDI
ncbi:hypothetical protein BBP40_000452 [Aspergillus hancockii]|nr:hypothetical protein BBP40_000452 [Aspergillus hancockii]